MPHSRAFPRRADLALAAVLGVGALAFLVLRTGVVRSALGSPQALAVLGVAGGLSVALGVLTWRATHRPVLARGLALLPVTVLFGWSEVLPAVRGDVVVQQLSPLAATAPLVPGPVAGPVVSVAPPATVPPATAPPAAAPTPASRAQLLGAAPLRGIDHDAGGTVQLIRGGDGGLVVRFEGFSVERGPDYRLYVVPAAGARSTSGGTSLGRFRATQGSVNVPVPRAFDASGPVTVLIWCRTYAVPVANATVLR